MMLDSWLVARLARELEELLRGARVQSAHASATELLLFCYRRGATPTLHVVLDQNAPLAAVTDEVTSQKEKTAGGWASAISPLLRGCIVDAVHALPNDRVVFVDLSSRSAFGVPALTRIVLELQPQKANVLALRSTDDKQWLVVAAAKQFAPPVHTRSGNREQPRGVSVGALYVAPPDRQARLDRAQFILMCDAAAHDRSALQRLLVDFDPSCTPPLAREVVQRVLGSAPAAALPRQLLKTWDGLRAEVAAAAERDDALWVYRQQHKLIACHLVALTWPGTDANRVAAMNALCASALEQRTVTKSIPAVAGLQKKLETMLRRCDNEVAALQRAQRTAQAADELRLAGDTIYAHLSDIPAGASHYEAEHRRVALDPRLSAKQNAAQYFKRYKKARSGQPQIEARLRALAANREYWEQLVWELERASALAPEQQQTIVTEIGAAVGSKQRAAGAPKRAREERKVTLSDGAIAYVGRSPKDNERLTFSIAGPNDYWFHARAIPGAHVIVKTDGAPISEQQILEAAALAAGQSRGASSASVEVDFTQRKHVRRQSAGRPGLVWYDHFKTVRVAPSRSFSW